MTKTIKLVMVSDLNNNKFYNLTDTENGNFKVEYGRIGVTSQTGTYPISKWNSIYNSKIRKGYKDVTELFKEEATSSVDFSDIENLNIKLFINKLQAYTNNQIKTFYNITSKEVTKKQIEEAQFLLNELVITKDIHNFNKILLMLYSIIPRKMSNVKNNLVVLDKEEIFNKIILKEQDLLDNMASQVKQDELVKENIDSANTILDAMGIEIFEINNDEKQFIKTKLEELSNNFSYGFRVVNKKTEKIFNEFLNNVENKSTELFWHGSRNPNWIGILEKGLLIRPTGASYSGSMYGDGIYGASSAKKSFGYTSGLGSYWAKGNSNEAYMALYDFHIGNQLVIEKHESWCYSLSSAQLKLKGNYHSTYAKKGSSLMNDEFIVYDPAQTNIKFIVCLKT